MPLKLNSAGGGSVTIDTPSTASNFTLTVPAANATVLTTASTSGMAVPAFSAYQSTGQAITATVQTKINYETEEWDTNSNFASSRFTPTIAGYYQINGAVSFSGTASQKQISVYRNGTSYKKGNEITTSTQITMSTLVYLNGSTDYVEIYAFSSNSVTIDALSDRTWFSGCLVRAA